MREGYCAQETESNIAAEKVNKVFAYETQEEEIHGDCSDPCGASSLARWAKMRVKILRGRPYRDRHPNGDGGGTTTRLKKHTRRLRTAGSGLWAVGAGLVECRLLRCGAFQSKVDKVLQGGAWVRAHEN